MATSRTISFAAAGACAALGSSLLLAGQQGDRPGGASAPVVREQVVDGEPLGDTDPATPRLASSAPAGSGPAVREGITLPAQWHPGPPSQLGIGDDVAPVDPVRVGRGGVLGLPHDPSRVGWWSGGAGLGAPFGAVVLAGHLDSRDQGVGFLARLAGLTPGDRVRVAGARMRTTYEVTDSFLVDADRISADDRLFSTRGPARLTIITCGGAYVPGRGYASNRVVQAVPLGR